MTEQKIDLRAAFRSLDPARPLERSLLATHYAQRPGAPAAKLADEIKERTQPFRAVVAGQRGVGKTTELNWLREELERSYERVFLVDLGRVATTNAVTALAYLTKKLMFTVTPDDQQTALVKKHSWLNWDFEIIGAVLNPEMITEVVGTFKSVATAGHQPRSREPILLMDGWERVSSNAEVYPFMDALERINCSTVLVTRLSVILDAEFNRFLPDWDLTVLPAIPLFTYERSRDDEGWSLLNTALDKRTGDLAFTRDARRIIIQGSGGIFRELVSLARHACLLAERARKDQVTGDEAEAALTEQRLKLTATMTPRDHSFLTGFAGGDRRLVERSLLEQVNLGRIVGYHRDSLWFDVHPILWPLMGFT